MTDAKIDPSEVIAFRAEIRAFIDGRLNDKLEKLDSHDEEKRRSVTERYESPTWLADAARRAAQIRLVHFGVKFTHPDARGSSLYLDKSLVDAPDLVGTHSLGSERVPDVVGNAASLDVYKFLQIICSGKSLLQRVIDADPALKAALSDDPVQAEEWMRAFGAIVREDGAPESHRFSKQLYFPLPDGSYHLLAPLFPSSLVHSVHAAIQNDRFSESSKEARLAHKEGRPWPQGYREYPYIVIQKFGGTKPQNVSLLNSERRGEAYLLPSCPPNWRNSKPKAPTHVQSVFSSWFGRRREVRKLVDGLRQFLARTRHNNRDIRQTRRDLVEAIRDELIQFAAELHELPAGWSADSECQLDLVEAIWLDPYRARNDAAFAVLRRGEWRDAICERFARWLNASLRTPHMPMGDAEFNQWYSDLEDELRLMRVEISDDE